MNKAKSGSSPQNDLNKTNSSRLVLYNDDVNDFGYVIKTLKEVLSYDDIQAFQLTLLTHYKGNITISEGDESKLEKFQEELEIAGLISIILYNEN